MTTPITLRPRCAICGNRQGTGCSTETTLFLAPPRKNGTRIVNNVGHHTYTEAHQSKGICHCLHCLEQRRIEWAEHYLLNETDPDMVGYWELKAKERRI